MLRTIFHLAGQNRIFVLGGDVEEVEVVRRAIANRWPYPISKDSCVSAMQITNANDNNEQTTNKSDPPSSMYEQIWGFKVKRYPWAISYGSKKIDRVVESAKHVFPHLVIPPPHNMDPDSGKSILMFILKVI